MKSSWQLLFTEIDMHLNWCWWCFTACCYFAYLTFVSSLLCPLSFYSVIASLTAFKSVFYYHLWMQRGATFCLSVFWALTFESLDLGMCFLVCRCVFRISRSALTHTCHGHWVNLRSKEQKVCLCVLFMGGLPSFERLKGSCVHC